MTRADVLSTLPPGGHVAEIGVARGAFSAAILRICEPDRLHLIDPWRHIADAPNSHLDPHNVADDLAERRYRKIVARFAGTPAVVIHRGLSSEILPTFPDGSLDWAYIDGDHRYEAVRTDLELCRQKVKPGGLILGHDYTESAYARSLGFGVVRAVNEFVAAHGWRIVTLTDEDFPTYVLAPEPRS